MIDRGAVDEIATHPLSFFQGWLRARPPSDSAGSTRDNTGGVI